MHILVLGPAASGKTMVAQRFGGYLETDHSVRYVNLDPGVEGFPLGRSSRGERGFNP